MMTSIQARVFDFVRDFRDEHGYPPTVREIRDALGYGSTASVQRHLNNLRRLGYLEGTGRRLRPTRAASR
jgi:repressor LexA